MLKMSSEDAHWEAVLQALASAQAFSGRVNKCTAHTQHDKTFQMRKKQEQCMVDEIYKDT